MLYAKNVPLWERFLRLAVAAALMAFAFGLVKGPLLSALLVGSAVLLALTAFFGFCPACAMVGRRIDKAIKAKKAA